MRDNSYRLATYAASDGSPRAGIVVDERVIDVSSALASLDAQALASSGATVLGVLQNWREMHPRLRDIARGARKGTPKQKTLPLSDVRLLAPILYPGTIFCAGANYRDHVAEMTKAMNLALEPDPREKGFKPWHFIKASTPCVRGPDSSIALPAHSQRVDWEAEIALVIGRECREVSVERALEHVAGLTIVNDLSARDHLRREGMPVESPFRFDWLSAKSFDGALPMGPWICPFDEIEDSGNLGIKLWLNDELMQDSSSSNLIFSMAEQIAHLSTRVTLRPGDVIATGTPAGVGAPRGRFLKPGDRVRIWVESVGELTHGFTG
jgi:2-keto-4-pentenoate hydratase/2-oxohepta-3-ene-1,7-dioic acid hydratase in catechol pathway